MKTEHVEFDYILREDNDDRLNTVVLDGYHHHLMLENLINSRGEKVAKHIQTNSKKAVSFFADPKKETSRSKILCLGKVQSGKTAFFISSIALAFDNGYNVCFLFGGTKNNLLDQNLTRLSQEFDNNYQVKILVLKDSKCDKILKLINDGFKVIVIVLKNVSSKQTNLYLALDFAETMKDVPILIVDDESDEHTPGAPKMKSRNNRAGITHDVISDILFSFKNITMMFITATPQANLLLSTLDELSPDYAVLVEPGESYTGGDAFHDLMSNPHVITIDDTDDFKFTIPDSYKSALKYFMLGTIIEKIKNPNKPFSMLIHPSHLKKVQKNIVEKISDDLEDLKEIIFHSNHPFHAMIIEDFQKIYENEFNVKYSFESIIRILINSLDFYKVYEYNTSAKGMTDIEESKKDENILFKIYVGGNMLSRGVTIPNLIVTYMYRDSKVSAIDTLYQRARWFGYKRNYFDVCRVYMTKSLKEKFIAIADNERDLWVSVSEFLETKINLKEYKRIFSLDHDKLIITRRTVSKTITLQRIKSGYTYDKSILFSAKDIYNNNEIIKSLIEEKNYKSEIIKFALNDSQNHLIITSEYTELYKNFISKFKFQRNSVIGPIPFKKILEQVKDGMIENLIKIVIMRYKTGQYRSLSLQGNSIKELPQGYDIGTEYPGDKNLTGLENKLQLQIHLVYTDKTEKKIIPLLAFNNPLTKYSIRYVTGDEFIYDL